MPRIRTVKPEFWSSEDTCSVSRDARLLWIALWNFADDEGRGNASPRQVRIQVFPGDTDITDARVASLLVELHEAAVGFKLYEADGKPYYWVPPESWKHQRINKKQPPKFPEPSDTVPGIVYDRSWNSTGTPEVVDNTEKLTHSVNSVTPVPDHSSRIGKDSKGEDGKGREGRGGPASLLGTDVWTEWEKRGGVCGDFSYQEKHCSSIARQCNRLDNPRVVLKRAVGAIWDAKEKKNTTPKIEWLAEDFGMYSSETKPGEPESIIKRDPVTKEVIPSKNPYLSEGSIAPKLRSVDDA